MKNTKILSKLLALTLIALMALMSLTACGADKKTDKKSDDEKITVTVTVVAEDKTEKEFKIETDKKYLGDALLDEGLVTEDEHKAGFYTYIDGVRADYSKDGAWWCFTKGGETVMVGANEMEMTDGDEFEITHTPA